MSISNTAIVPDSKIGDNYEKMLHNYNETCGTINTSDCREILYCNTATELVIYSALEYERYNKDGKKFIKTKIYVPLSKNYRYKIDRSYDALGSIRIVDNIYEGDVDSITLFVSPDQVNYIPISTVVSPKPGEYIRFFKDDLCIRKFPFHILSIEVKFSKKNRWSSRNFYLELEVSLISPDLFDTVDKDVIKHFPIPKS